MSIVSYIADLKGDTENASEIVRIALVQWKGSPRVSNEKSMSHCYGNIHLMLCEIRIKSSSQILKADIAKSTFTQWIQRSGFLFSRI